MRVFFSVNLFCWQRRLLEVCFGVAVHLMLEFKIINLVLRCLRGFGGWPNCFAIVSGGFLSRVGAMLHGLDAKRIH